MIKKSEEYSYWYNLYMGTDEKLMAYKKKGGFYRHIYSLPCRYIRAYYRRKAIKAIHKAEDMPILDNQSGVVVSLTTFPPRIAQLHLVLKSILCQTFQPERILVWLSKEEFPGEFNDLPDELKSLRKNGVELRFVPENLRSHKKYYYTFKEFPDKSVITVDDDLIYPCDTFERLISLSINNPHTVCGNVIRKIRMEENRFATYKKWRKVSYAQTNSSLVNVAVGYGGILYPPKWYDEMLFNKQVIRERCPFADDLWLKANQLRQNVKVVGGGKSFSDPITLPNTQKYSLQKKNNGSLNMNDAQWNSLNELFGLDKLVQREL